MLNGRLGEFVKKSVFDVSLSSDFKIEEVEIDKDHIHMLITIGLSQLGFFMAIPSVFSALCLLVGFICLSVQTAAEEKHLTILLPKEYFDYCKNVRRWV